LQTQKCSIHSCVVHRSHSSQKGIPRRSGAHASEPADPHHAATNRRGTAFRPARHRTKSQSPAATARLIGVSDVTHAGGRLVCFFLVIPTSVHALRRENCPLILSGAIGPVNNPAVVCGRPAESRND